MLGVALIVLSTEDIHTIKPFYEALGACFRLEKHGKGPEHFSAQLRHGLVFELYPGKYDGKTVGFRVFSLEETLGKLMSLGINVEKQASLPSGAKLAIVRDPDGRRVELYEGL